MVIFRSAHISIILPSSAAKELVQAKYGQQARGITMNTMLLPYAYQATAVVKGCFLLFPGLIMYNTRCEQALFRAWAYVRHILTSVSMLALQLLLITRSADPFTGLASAACKSHALCCMPDC